MTEFLVHASRHEGDTVFVSGVVNAGSVRVGTVFDAVGKTSVTKMSDDDRSVIRLQVTQITAYGHQLDDLPEGMTGELIVKGDGVDYLIHGVFLSSVV